MFPPTFVCLCLKEATCIFCGASSAGDSVWQCFCTVRAVFCTAPCFFIRRRVERHFAPCIFLCIFSFLYYILLYLLITILLLYCYLLTYYQHITSYLITFLRHIFFLWLKCSAIFWPDSCPFHPGFCCGGLTCLFANFAPLVQSLGPDAGWMSLTSGRRRTAWRPWIHFWHLRDPPACTPPPRPPAGAGFFFSSRYWVGFGWVGRWVNLHRGRVCIGGVSKTVGRWVWDWGKGHPPGWVTKWIYGGDAGPPPEDLLQPPRPRFFPGGLPQPALCPSVGQTGDLLFMNCKNFFHLNISFNSRPETPPSPFVHSDYPHLQVVSEKQLSSPECLESFRIIHQKYER